MTDSRTITIKSLTEIRIDGLTAGPPAGWSLVGDDLVHRGGNRFPLTASAAARIRALAETAVPATSRELTGFQIGQLPAAEADEFRAACTFSGVSHGVHGVYVVRTAAQPAVTTLGRADLR